MTLKILTEQNLRSTCSRVLLVASWLLFIPVTDASAQNTSMGFNELAQAIIQSRMEHIRYSGYVQKVRSGEIYDYEAGSTESLMSIDGRTLKMHPYSLEHRYNGSRSSLQVRLVPDHERRNYRGPKWWWEARIADLDVAGISISEPNVDPNNFRDYSRGDVSHRVRIECKNGSECFRASHPGAFGGPHATSSQMSVLVQERFVGVSAEVAREIIQKALGYEPPPSTGISASSTSVDCESDEYVYHVNGKKYHESDLPRSRIGGSNIVELKDEPNPCNSVSLDDEDESMMVDLNKSSGNSSSSVSSSDTEVKHMQETANFLTSEIDRSMDASERLREYVDSTRREYQSAQAAQFRSQGPQHSGTDSPRSDWRFDAAPASESDDPSAMGDSDPFDSDFNFNDGTFSTERVESTPMSRLLNDPGVASIVETMSDYAKGRIGDLLKPVIGGEEGPSIDAGFVKVRSMTAAGAPFFFVADKVEGGVERTNRLYESVGGHLDKMWGGTTDEPCNPWGDSMSDKWASFWSNTDARNCE
jgi:hypothetical protein